MKDLVSNETVELVRLRSETQKAVIRQSEKGPITTVKILLTFPALAHRQSKERRAKRQNIRAWLFKSRLALIPD